MVTVMSLIIFVVIIILVLLGNTATIKFHVGLFKMIERGFIVSVRECVKKVCKKVWKKSGGDRIVK
jgi:hypothetical protein